MRELKSEIEYSLLDMVQKAANGEDTEINTVNGKATRFSHLNDEAQRLILHGSAALVDEIAAIPGFDSHEAQQIVRKYWREARCGNCGSDCSYNMLDGIKTECRQCHKRTKELAFDHPQMAAWLMQNYHFLNGIESDTLYIYNEDTGTYESHAEAVIQQELETVAHDTIRQRVITEVINHIKNASMCHVDSLNGAVKKIEEDILIHVANGVYSVRQRRLLQQGPKYHFIRYIPHRYDANARCPRIIAFLRECFEPDFTMMINVIESGAYVLSPTNHLGRAVLNEGTGGNGKGTWLSVLRTLLGKDLAKGLSIQQLTDRPFAVASLYGALANIGIDIPKTKLWDSSIFKALTTDDSWLSAEFKNKPIFEFANTCKLYFSANHIPSTSDTTDAFFDRWLIPQWRHRFRDTPKQDKDLLKKLTTESELSGLLNLFITLLPYVMEIPNFTYGQGLEAVTDLYLTKSDSVQAFIKDCVVHTPVGTDLSGVGGLIDNTLIFKNGAVAIDKGDVKRLYERYCQDRKLIPESEKLLFTGLQDHFPSYYDGRKQDKGITIHYCVGIRLKEIPQQTTLDVDSRDYDQIVKEYLGTVNKVLEDRKLERLQGLEAFLCNPDTNPDTRTVMALEIKPATYPTPAATLTNKVLVSPYINLRIQQQLLITPATTATNETSLGIFTADVITFKVNGTPSTYTVSQYYTSRLNGSVVTTPPFSCEASPVSVSYGDGVVAGSQLTSGADTSTAPEQPTNKLPSVYSAIHREFPDGSGHRRKRQDIVDSLKQQGFPDDKITEAIDSLNRWGDIYCPTPDTVVLAKDYSVADDTEW